MQKPSNGKKFGKYLISFLSALTIVIGLSSGTALAGGGGGGGGYPTFDLPSPTMVSMNNLSYDMGFCYIADPVHDLFEVYVGSPDTGHYETHVKWTCFLPYTNGVYTWDREIDNARETLNLQVTGAKPDTVDSGVPSDPANPQIHNWRYLLIN